MHLRCAAPFSELITILPSAPAVIPPVARSLALSELSLAPFSKFGLPLPSLPRSHLTIDWPDSQYCSQPPVRPSIVFANSDAACYGGEASEF